MILYLVCTHIRRELPRYHRILQSDISRGYREVVNTFTLIIIVADTPLGWRTAMSGINYPRMLVNGLCTLRM